MKKLLVSFMLFFALTTFAQLPTFEWAKSWSGGSVEIYDVSTDNLGNVYTTGAFSSSSNIGPNSGVLAPVYVDENPNWTTGRNVFLTKMTASGDVIWTKTFGGLYNDVGKAVKVDSDGNVFVVGEFKGEVDFNPDVPQYFVTSGSVYNDAGNNSFIVKFGPTGNFLFAKAFVGTYDQEMNDLDVDLSGNLFVTGSFRGLNNFAVDFDPGFGNFNIQAQNSDIFIVKLENDGDFLWAKSFSGGSTYYQNVEDRDKGNAIRVDNSGNIFIVGSFQESVDFDPGSGVTLLSSNGYTDAFIAKLNSSGNLQWVKNIGGNAKDFGKSMDIDAIGNVYTYGYFDEYDNEPLVDFNPNAGVTNLVLNQNIRNVVVKLTSTGDFAWAKRFQGNSTTHLNGAKCFDVDLSGNVFVLESFSGTVNTPKTYDFDEGSGVFNMTSSNDGNYVCKINTDGNFVTAYRTGSNFSFLTSSAFCVSLTGELYATGTYYGVIDFDPTLNVFNLLDYGYAGYIQKMASQSLLLHENEKLKVVIFPNPTSSNLNVIVPNTIKNGNLKIISSAGKIVIEKQSISGSALNIDVSNLSQGLYFLQISDSTNKFTSKFLKK